MRLKKIIVTIMGLAMPVTALAQQATKLENPIGTDVDAIELFARVAGGLNFITSTLALVVIVLGGYWILTAAGNAERYTKGKKMIGYALLGLFVAIGSYAILATTISVLTGTPTGFAKEGLTDPLNLIEKGKAAPFIFYGERILGTLINGLGGVTLLMFVIAGFMWFTAGGNEERLGRAKKTLLYAVIGLIVVLSSYMVVTFALKPLYALFSA